MNLKEVYLRAYEAVCGARSSIARYIDFHNGVWTQSSLADLTPDAAYFGYAAVKAAA